jgi:hypothetical protein
MKPSLNKFLGSWLAIFLGTLVLKWVADEYGWLIALVPPVSLAVCVLMFARARSG